MFYITLAYVLINMYIGICVSISVYLLYIGMNINSERLVRRFPLQNKVYKVSTSTMEVHSHVCFCSLEPSSDLLIGLQIGRSGCRAQFSLCSPLLFTGWFPDSFPSRQFVWPAPSSGCLLSQVTQMWLRATESWNRAEVSHSHHWYNDLTRHG